MNPTPENSNNDTDTTAWHIIQTEEGVCDIVDQLEFDQHDTSQKQTWGPFSSRPEALAKRVGLIRAGKCLPK